jgi:UDP-glucose 4-epimerase
VTVLVTGAMGAIGSEVIHRLVAEGERPVAMDLRPDTELIEDVLSDVEPEFGDIRDWANVARIIHRHGVTSVIHLAVLLPDNAQRDPKLATEVNVEATVAILELARSFDLRRVVMASSKGVYRPIEGEHAHPTYVPVNEDYPIGPTNVYDVTKYAAEQLGLNYARSHKVDFLALRFAATYGPGRMTRHGSFALSSAIVENAFFGRPTILEKGGEQQDDFVYTKDVAQALVKAVRIDRRRLVHRVFNIGTGQPSTLTAAAAVLRKAIPGAQIEIGPGPDYGTGAGLYCIFDISRARAELEYEPQYDHEQGILDYLARLATKKDTPRD